MSRAANRAAMPQCAAWADDLRAAGVDIGRVQHAAEAGRVIGAPGPVGYVARCAARIDATPASAGMSRRDWSAR